MLLLLPLVLVLGLGLVVALWVWAGLIVGLIALTLVCVVMGYIVDRNRRNKWDATRDD